MIDRRQASCALSKVRAARGTLRMRCVEAKDVRNVPEILVQGCAIALWTGATVTVDGCFETNRGVLLVICRQGGADGDQSVIILVRLSRGLSEEGMKRAGELS